MVSSTLSTITCTAPAPDRMNPLLLTRLTFLLYVIAPLVSGIDAVVHGRMVVGVSYLALSVLYAVVLGFIRMLPPRNSVSLQTVGAVLLIIISFDMFRQGRQIIPYLFIFMAVLNIYILWFGDKITRRPRKSA